MLAAHPEVEVVGEAATVDLAVAPVRALAPDAVFLDIHLPPDSGFALLERRSTARPGRLRHRARRLRHSRVRGERARLSAQAGASRSVRRCRSPADTRAATAPATTDAAGRGRSTTAIASSSRAAAALASSRSSASPPSMPPTTTRSSRRSTATCCSSPVRCATGRRVCLRATSLASTAPPSSISSTSSGRADVRPRPSASGCRADAPSSRRHAARLRERFSARLMVRRRQPAEQAVSRPVRRGLKPEAQDVADIPHRTFRNQLTAAELPDEHWEVVVVGAGPAGSAAAITLARAGAACCCSIGRASRATRCVAMRSFPTRSAVCPGLASATTCVRSGMRRRSSPSTARRGCVSTFPDRSSRSSGRSSTRFSRRAPWPPAPVSSRLTWARCGPRACGGWKSCSRARSPLRARAALTTTGARVELLERHGLVSRPRASAMALRCYVQSSARIDELVISYDAAIAPGYAWIFPMGGGEYNVGCGAVVPRGGRAGLNLRRDFDTFVAPSRLRAR